MNPDLSNLHPYPFERMTELLGKVTPATGLEEIAWSLGEPKHEAPDFLVETLQDEAIIRKGFGTYPPTRGLPELRVAIADFITRRFKLGTALDPDRQVLPVGGTREALFAFAQTVNAADTASLTLMPNPFYQIYEGAALLSGSQPYYLNCDAASGFVPDFSRVPADVWSRCSLIYICSPGNPTGAVMPRSQLRELIQLSDEFNFVIASDECYSEIYADESAPPPGLLEVASEMGRHGFANCVAFNSLSKRSNLPGLRSGYVAGDADILEKFLLYRTYHGSAMPVHHQLISTAAWRDEEHVRLNRTVYREKFAGVTDVLTRFWPMETPAAAFYLWPETPMDDPTFTVRLIETANVKVLPGSFLSRRTPAGNPGRNRVRMALVADRQQCIEAAERIAAAWDRL